MSLFGTAKRVLLVICDGMGFSDNENQNAVRDAKTPNLDSFLKTYPNTTIEPGGELVGLPKGVSGNSEVGHMNIGAGRPVRQDLVRINEAIEKDTLKDMKELVALFTEVKSKSNRLHIMGLLSDGGVHSHIDHIKEVFKIAKKAGVEIYFHAFMDGRDTPQKSGVSYIEELEKLTNFKFASMQGRSIGMDRDRRWEKVEKAYKMMTGQADITELSPIEYIKAEYEKGLFDEFITPVLFGDNSKVKSDDSAFFINFRPDRAKEISQAFVDSNFEHFDNSIRPSRFLCMSPYIDEEFPEVPILFNRENVKGTLSEFLSKKGLKQLKIAETEKYAHVTYFFNGGAEKPFDGEKRILVESPREVATYDLKPQMSAPEVLEKLVNELSNKDQIVSIVNFANPDMVGHTGNYKAAVAAVEYIDGALAVLKEKCLAEGISMLITADHGNCDQMAYSDGSPHTSHTNAKVPFILIQKGLENKEITIKNKDDALMDISPTIIHLLGIEKPSEFTGSTIFN
jgi:2,3-bisphosphoglycerate-independent phosphoglycerate mutase